MPVKSILPDVYVPPQTLPEFLWERSRKFENDFILVRSLVYFFHDNTGGCQCATAIMSPVLVKKAEAHRRVGSLGTVVNSSAFNPPPRAIAVACRCGLIVC